MVTRLYSLVAINKLLAFLLDGDYQSDSESNVPPMYNKGLSKHFHGSEFELARTPPFTNEEDILTLQCAMPVVAGPKDLKLCSRLKL
jgi:hypothetical protein